MWWAIPALSVGWVMGKPTPLSPPPTTNLWKPALYTLGATTTAYIGLAAMEGLHNRLTNGAYARKLRERKRDYALHQSTRRSLAIHGGLSLTVVGLNLAVFYCGKHNPKNYLRLADCHQTNWKRNWTLLTAAFCHMSWEHLAANMVSLVPGIPPLLQTCGQSPYQFVAFYCSAAIFSSYAQRIVSHNRWTHSWVSFFGFTAPRILGASGVAMAVFATSCLSQPWRSPSFFVSAWTLSYQVTNDVLGLLYSKEAIGFAAHLAGALYGAAYTYLNLDHFVWKKLVRFFSGHDEGQDREDRPKPRNQSRKNDDLTLDELVRRLNSTI